MHLHLQARCGTSIGRGTVIGFPLTYTRRMSKYQIIKLIKCTSAFKINPTRNIQTYFV